MVLRLVRTALKKGKAEKLSEGLEYIRFRESFRSVERGTVIVGKRIIWGFPQITRIYTLKKGLEKNMADCELYAEEKIDGFNVRIAYINGKIYGFSRGGFLDTFVTEKSRNAKLEKFFKKHPGYVLCGEMLGNTPYTKPTKDFDVKLFVFDIDEGDGIYLPYAEKYKLLKKYGMAYPPVLGKFKSNDHKGLRKLILSLNKGKKEGFVLKRKDRKDLVKYVTPNSDIEDISEASDAFFDMPIGFFYQRVLRSAFFIDEFNLNRDKYSLMLGKAFYKGLNKAIKQAKNNKPINNEYEILVRNTGIWNDIKKHMSRDVQLEELWRLKEKGKTRIRFRKIYKKSTRRLTSYAAGKGVTD